ncbi:MAG: hypothetical protein AAFR66_18335, partial [Bacteroidota bacterium]
EDFEAFEDGDEFEFLDKILKHIPAKLQIKRNEQYVMKLQGEAFVLDEEKLVGNNIESTILINEEDSIYHPALDLRYTVTDRRATLYKPKKGSAKSIPFTSSYHEYYLYFETIIWNLETDDITFTALIDQENKVSAIESFDYYTKARFNQFKNILSFNPIGAIYRYTYKHPKEPIFPEKVLEDYKLQNQKTAFQRSLPGLEGSGFIKYDKQTYEIYPLPKLYKWARAARGKKDFDAIQVISKVDTGAHAVMNINNQEFRMSGVPYFSLSDSQYVRVVPLEGEVLVQEKRDLLFAGAVASGKLNLYANDEDNRPRFTFDYENFNIICDSLDSIRFVLVRDPQPGYEPTPLERALSKTVFENVTGTIHIDDPQNKSGKENNPQYPVFDSYASSYLYWDKPSIQGGVYSKDRFYFSVDPFVLDSLENFDDQGLKFGGEFFSSEIFPTFRQDLTVMPDFTLGFVEETPEEGYDVYDYQGKYTGKIFLDGTGLHGSGKLESIDAVMVSDSFSFHFDSVMAVIDTFDLPSSFNNPEVKANTSIYKWYTKLDKVVLSTADDSPIQIFDGNAEFRGTIAYSKDGLIGNGSVRIGQVEIAGDSIVLRERDFEASGSEFAIVDSLNPEEYHFRATNVDIDYDVWRRSARFEGLEKGRANAAFPIHNYMTSLTSGEYRAGDNKLDLRGITRDSADNYFISTSVQGDSLKFAATKAYYSVSDRKIEIDGVPAIYVADALITPEYAEVEIEQNGLIKELENATIEMNQETKYHRIYDATVQIISGSEYEGTGKYDYIKVKGKDQYINFEQIQVNGSRITTASGELTDAQEFYLTDRIFFRGNATLDASRKFLSFEGEVKIESENPVFKGAWFKFEKTIVNPDSVYIPIPERLTNDGGDLLTVGLNFIPETRTFYSLFLQAKDNDTDLDIISASGGLTLDRTTKEFKIGSEAKIKNQTYKGTAVSFDDVNNVITSQGYFRFPYNFAEKTISVEMAGSWRDDLKSREISTNILMLVDMSIIPQEPLEGLAKNLTYLTISNKDIDFLQQNMLENAAEFLDKGKNEDKETQKFIDVVKNSMVFSDIDLAGRFGNTIALSDVNFHYSYDEAALYHDGEIGVIGIGGNTVNKKVNAKIVYEFGDISPSGEVEEDMLTIYLEVDEFNWAYFRYVDGVVETVSKYYDDYNYPLKDIQDKRKNNEGFRFEVVDEDQVAEFKQDFILKYIKK